MTAIQSEIKTAIENTPQNQNCDSDGRSGIKSVIDSVLETHGLEPAEIQEQFKSLAGPPPGGPPPGANGANQSGNITSTNYEKNTIELLLSTGELDSETAHLLQGLLPSLDATA